MSAAAPATLEGPSRDVNRAYARRMAGELWEVARLFLKLGTIAFGGPAAHIALMRDEVVKRRGWLSDARFLDLLGMTNLIPGPNSTEMAIHVGYARAGGAGLVTAGVCFVVPAMLIVLGLAWAYVRYGAQPEVGWLLYGIKPVIIAVVVQAMWALVRTAVKSVLLGVVGAVALALYLAGANELILLFGGGILVMVARGRERRGGETTAVSGLVFLSSVGASAQVATAAAPYGLGTLFLTFLKIGSVLYGSGYVLLAFLRGDFVDRLHWLTDQQLLDAVAVGQFTPGPVFTTATFVGYLVGGWGGALAATVAIFLPSFVFVALSHPLIPRIRGSALTAGFLDGVNVAALGLMAAVTWELGRAAVVDGLTSGLAAVAALLLLRYRLNSAWLVLGGGLVGLVSHVLAR
jgi:chromate transporter